LPPRLIACEQPKTGKDSGQFKLASSYSDFNVLGPELGAKDYAVSNPVTSLLVVRVQAEAPHCDLVLVVGASKIREHSTPGNLSARSPAGATRARNLQRGPSPDVVPPGRVLESKSKEDLWDWNKSLPSKSVHGPQYARRALRVSACPRSRAFNQLLYTRRRLVCNILSRERESGGTEQLLFKTSPLVTVNDLF